MKNEIITERDLGLEIIEGKETEFYSKDNNSMTIRYGARGIVEGKDGKIAVIYKKNKNEYKLPGGGVDKGEDFTEQEKEEGLEYLWLDKKEALEKMKACIENLKGSKYDNVYRTKFVVGRDIRILERYMKF